MVDLGSVQETAHLKRKWRELQRQGHHAPDRYVWNLHVISYAWRESALLCHFGLSEVAGFESMSVEAICILVEHRRIDMDTCRDLRMKGERGTCEIRETRQKHCEK